MSASRGVLIWPRLITFVGWAVVNESSSMRAIGVARERSFARHDLLGSARHRRSNDPHQLIATDVLLFQEQVDHRVEGVATLREQLGCTHLGFGENASHLFVDDELGSLGVGAGGERILSQICRSEGAETNWSEARRESPVTNHPSREVCC